MGIELFMENGLALTRLFQENFFNLHSVMQIINYATEPETIFLLLISIYWGTDRNTGSRYIYLWALILAVFSICQHALQMPAPFWFDSSILHEESGSFAAPNLNIAVSLLLVIPFTRLIRPDLVLVVFILMATLSGLSQIYLGVANLFDVIFGLLLGGILIGLWHLWNRRFGRSFAQRILGQRFWLAIAFPLMLALGYLFLMNWIERIGYAGPTAEIDSTLYWRAWQTGALNSISSLAILAGLGMGITYETSRVGFKPAGTLGGAFLNLIIGFALLGSITYGLMLVFPISGIYGSSRYLDYALLILKFSFIALSATYFIPWIFTLIGTAESDLSETPEISLNNFA